MVGRYEKISRTQRVYIEDRGPGLPESRIHEVKCCGSWIELTAHTNFCECCGNMWNKWGQRLAPVEFWGEETGEFWADAI